MRYDKVILHVGLPKTGTSSIQRFCNRNRAVLRKGGFAYFGPDCLTSYPQGGPFWREEALAAGLSELNSRCSKAGARSLVWSRESLSNCAVIADQKRVEMIRDELPADAHQVIVYLRRQDKWVESAYLEWGIKNKGYPGPIKSFDQWFAGLKESFFSDLRTSNLDYHGLVEPWVAVFGRDNVTIRVFEREQLTDGDLLRDFCRVGEIPDAKYAYDIPRSNVSFNMELHQMLGMYNSAFEGPAYPQELIWYLDHLGQSDFLTQSTWSRFRVDPKVRVEILQMCDEANQRVAREFMNRDDGVLFREPWPDADEPFEPCAELTIEKVVPIFMHLLFEQHRRIRRLERALSIAGSVPRALQKVLPARVRAWFARLRNA